MIGVKVIRKQKHDVQKGLAKGYLQGLTEILIGLQTQSKVFSPVDKGILRASIQKKITKDNKGFVFTNVKYAIYQEEGSKAANNGKGFLKPAADWIRPKIGAIMGKFIRSGLRSN